MGKSTRNVPVDKKLYEKVKETAKKKFEVWPSAYGSGWLVQEYKRQFEKKHGKRKSPYKKTGGGKRNSRRLKSRSHKRRRSTRRTHRTHRTHRTRKGGSLSRWFDEEWVNVCEKDKKGNFKPCGRKEANLKPDEYPYCRPLKRVNKNTPKTAKEMTKSEIKTMCKKKKRSMRKRSKKSKKRKSPTRVYVKNAK